MSEIIITNDSDHPVTVELPKQETIHHPDVTDTAARLRDAQIATQRATELLNAAYARATAAEQKRDALMVENMGI